QALPREPAMYTRESGGHPTEASEPEAADNSAPPKRDSPAAGRRSAPGSSADMGYSDPSRGDCPGSGTGSICSTRPPWSAHAPGCGRKLPYPQTAAVSDPAD